MADANLQIVVGADTSQASAALNAFSVAGGIGLEQLTEKFIEMGKAAVSSLIEAAGEFEDVKAQLDAVIESTATAEVVTQSHTETVGLSTKQHEEYAQKLADAENRLDNLNHTHVKGEDAVYKHDKAVKQVTADIADYKAKLETTTVTIEGKLIPAFKANEEQLLRMARDLSDVTTYSDEAAISAETFGLQYTKITQDMFPQFLMMSANVATALGRDLPSAAYTLARALEDPSQAAIRLRSMGVLLGDGQKELIKSLSESGKTAEAQKIILEELSKMYEGRAKAAAGTFDGQVLQLKNHIHDVEVAIGSQILNAIEPYIKKISDVVVSLGNWKNANYIINEWLEKNKNKIIEVTFVVGLLASAIGIAAVGAVFGLVAALTTLFVTLTIATGGLNIVAGVILMVVIKAILDMNKNVKDLGVSTQIVGLLIMSTTVDMANAFIDLANAVISAINTIDNAWNNSILGKLNQSKIPMIASINEIANTYMVDAQKMYDASQKTNAESIMSVIPNYAGTQSISAPVMSSHKALGGVASGLTLVGESGPELVNLPNGSYVTGQNQFNNGGGKGMGVTINLSINNPTIRSDNDIQNLVYQIQRTLGRQNELARLGAL